MLESERERMAFLGREPDADETGDWDPWFEKQAELERLEEERLKELDD